MRIDKIKCPNCGNTDQDTINADEYGATCWVCDYHSDFRDESWKD